MQSTEWRFLIRFPVSSIVALFHATKILELFSSLNPSTELIYHEDSVGSTFVI